MQRFAHYAPTLLSRFGGVNVRAVTSISRLHTTSLPASTSMLFRPNNAFPSLSFPRRSVHVSVGVPREFDPAETRVGITPEGAAALIKKGATVRVESKAGALSGFEDEEYSSVGAEVVDKATAYKQEVVVRVNGLAEDEFPLIEDRVVVGQLGSRLDPTVVEKLSKQGATGMDLTMLYRLLSRGQSFDVLSSQANIAGYRAVMEAAHTLQRPFAGQTTAAGKVKPSKVLVVGCGVAGLAAIQQAKNMNAIVLAFDVRAAAAGQAEAAGAKFLTVDFEEEGDGGGGYAKEMSPEWHAAARKMLLNQCKDVNVIITTALIPGKKAPVLITKEMVAAMPSNSVTVDLAAENGGNVETTTPGKVVRVGHVTCIGHLNMPGRMANTASALFSGNVSKLLLSMADKEGKFIVDAEHDDAVKSMCVVRAGEVMPAFVPPPPPVQKETKVVEDEVVVVDEEARVKSQAYRLTGGALAAVLAGATIPTGSGLLPTFALSVWVGSGAVQGVSHALHSPLMSITNAISGMTLVGGMLQLSSGWIPHTTVDYLAATAVVLSAVNLSGGFLVTKKMLDMFRRRDDPPEYWHYYLVPAASLSGIYSVMMVTGMGSPALSGAMALASGLGCIGGISAMASQKTARMAPYLGMGGVGMGLTTTLFAMDCSAATYMQLGGLVGIGGMLGTYVANRIEPTSLPQAVAAFHSLVGIAATSTAVGDYLIHDAAAMSTFHGTSVYLGAWMGAITATGSLVAYGKLAEKISSASLKLPNRDQINMSLGAISALGMLGFLTVTNPALASACLAAGVLSSGALGLHMTASIGGADTPVVITLLNSYSGWALCAEGFILDQPLLTIVGALIGSSGAFLTKIMCDGMNRSLPSVILGGFGTSAAVAGAKEAGETLPHTELDIDGTVQALAEAETIMISPGYGLAVAQAQNDVATMVDVLTRAGKKVIFACHPVAGRMPGQMNILLAEAGVDYDMVLDLEEANEMIANGDIDLGLVIGANDTVSPAADDPTSALAGMPVIRIFDAKQCLFVKRSMASGYSGAENPAFFRENCSMVLGDAKNICGSLVQGLKGEFEK